MKNSNKNNPWEKIYSTSDPEDLKKPYQLFNLVIENLSKNNVQKVLAITTGNGRHLIELAKKGFDVYGFDLSKKIIDLSNKNLKKQGLSAHLKTANMFENFPYEDEFFDGVIAMQAIYHGSKDNFSTSIKEAKRVLKKGQPFIFSVSRSHKRSMLGSEDNNFTAIDKYTIIPNSGREKGLMHFYPSKRMIKKITKEFFESTNIIEDNDNHYYLVFCK